MDIDDKVPLDNDSDFFEDNHPNCFMSFPKLANFLSDTVEKGLALAKDESWFVDLVVEDPGVEMALRRSLRAFYGPCVVRVGSTLPNPVSLVRQIGDFLPAFSNERLRASHECLVKKCKPELKRVKLLLPAVEPEPEVPRMEGALPETAERLFCAVVVARADILLSGGSTMQNKVRSYLEFLQDWHPSGALFALLGEPGTGSRQCEQIDLYLADLVGRGIRVTWLTGYGGDFLTKAMDEDVLRKALESRVFPRSASCGGKFQLRFIGPQKPVVGIRMKEAEGVFLSGAKRRRMDLNNPSHASTIQQCKDNDSIRLLVVSGSPFARDTFTMQNRVIAPGIVCARAVDLVIRDILGSANEDNDRCHTSGGYMTPCVHLHTWAAEKCIWVLEKAGEIKKVDMND